MSNGYRKSVWGLRSVIPLAVAAVLAAASDPPKVIVNPNDGLEYAWIPPGQFQMGCVPGDDQCDADEKPRHPVEITNGFWMGRREVPVAAFRRFVLDTGGALLPQPPDFDRDWKEDSHPIVNVPWFGASAYCEWAGGRLPTEAEWEYAARGGTEGLKYPWGNQITQDDAVFFKDGERDSRKSVPVAQFPPNGYGLYDTAGNVWEWVANLYHENYYDSLPQDKPSPDPLGPSYSTVNPGLAEMITKSSDEKFDALVQEFGEGGEDIKTREALISAFSDLLGKRVLRGGTLRHIRGGAWLYQPEDLRTSNRNQYEYSSPNVGFRCALEIAP